MTNNEDAGCLIIIFIVFGGILGLGIGFIFLNFLQAIGLAIISAFCSGLIGVFLSKVLK